MRAILCLLILCSTLACAQEGAKPKVIKSEPVEMAPAGNVVRTSMSSSVAADPPMISGDFTESSAHPKCTTTKATAQRTKCTADEVLAHLREHLKAAPHQEAQVVSVDFDVDEYGEVKSVRADAAGDPALGQALIAALFGMPKFEPAKKGATRTASHGHFSYPIEDLFAKPGTVTAAPLDSGKTATAEKAPDEVKAPPAIMTVNSNGQIITGDFTKPCVHPDCAKGKTAEERTACTATKVLDRIKANLKAEMPAYLDVVTVDFDIDVYGDVKTIRANCSAEPELGKAVIVALYGMPKFAPAQKANARAAAHCTFQYPVADLFAKP